MVPVGVAVVWLALVGAFEWLRPAGSDLTLCLFRNATGLPCPTCGTTRAVLAAADGRLADAASFNPFMATAALVGGAWGLTHLASRRSGRSERPRPHQRQCAAGGRSGAQEGARSGPPDESGGPYESECAAGGRYGALKRATLWTLLALLFVANWGYLIAREAGGS